MRIAMQRQVPKRPHKPSSMRLGARSLRRHRVLPSIFLGDIDVRLDDGTVDAYLATLPNVTFTLSGTWGP